MNNKPRAFQLEKSVPGTFLMQGALGGVLGGYVGALIGAIAWRETDFAGTLELTNLTVFYGAFIGVIKATLMWGVVRVTGIQYRAFTRVAASSILASLIIAALGWQFDFDEDFLPGCLIGSLSVGIPVALLVGSRVKPWEIFTFGSIAGATLNKQSTAGNIFRTLLTLPLRFMSIGAIALLLLFATPKIEVYDIDRLLLVTLFLTILLFYPLFSAYLTFRSPGKIALFVLGVLSNFPVILLGVACYRDYVRSPRWGEPLVNVVVCSSFIAAWAIFLVARLSAKTTAPPSLHIVDRKSIEYAKNLDHECLGSRFADWRERVA